MKPSQKKTKKRYVVISPDRFTIGRFSRLLHLKRNLDVNNLKMEPMSIKVPESPVNCKRQLKIYQKSIQRGKGYIPIPEIRLMGKWLQKEGFNCGQEIRVLHQKNRIIITNSEKIIIHL
jgi:toxic protein SymE